MIAKTRKQDFWSGVCGTKPHLIWEWSRSAAFLGPWLSVPHHLLQQGPLVVFVIFSALGLVSLAETQLGSLTLGTPAHYLA